jgi:polygalacturonase
VNQLATGLAATADVQAQFAKRGIDVTSAPYTADNSGVVDSTSTIQAAIDACASSGGGIVFFPPGTYKVSSTIKLKLNVILVGSGAGAYFAGDGYDRNTQIKPTSGFIGTDVFRADPADIDSGLSLVYGIAIRDMLINMINVKNSEMTAIKLMSLSNTETFENIRIINNNNGTAIYIGQSANASGNKSDGLVFSNIYTLPANNPYSPVSSKPIVHISCANEVSFRDCKFQQSDSATSSSTIAVLIKSEVADHKVAAITFDSCSFTSAEAGIKIQGNSADGAGPRWIRVQNCTFEGIKYGIYAIGVSTRPVQFCTFGPGNRFITLASGGSELRFGAYASNNQAYVDEFVSSVLIETNAVGNLVYGSELAKITDGGTSTGIITREGSAIRFNKLYIESWIAPTLGASWVSNTSSRTLAGYRKDTRKVYLKGYLTDGLYGFPNIITTLPTGYRPLRAVELTAASGSTTGACNLTVLNDGRIYATGGSSWLCLDGVEFFLD